jgi:tyrosyl-tRNA synthetase
VKSKGEARRLLQQGGLSANGAKLAAPVIARDALLGGAYVLLKKGGRSYALARIAG